MVLKKKAAIIGPFGGAAPPAWLPAPMRALPPDGWIDKTLGLAWFKQGNIIVPLSAIQTVSRPSTTYMYDSLGSWSPFGSNLAARSDLGQSIWATRTNLQLQNFDFTQAAGWSLANAQATVTMASPVSGFSAQKLADGNTTSAQHAAVGASMTITANTVYCASVLVYTGASDYPVIRLHVSNNSFSNAFYAALTLSTKTISTGVVGTSSIAASGVIDYGNGWVRVWIAGIVDSSSTAAKCTLYLNSGNTYAGVVGNGTFATGVQFELGAAPSPIMPTTTGTVTRSAEVDAILQTFLPAWGSAYTIYAEGFPEDAVSSGNDQVICQVDNGGGNDRFSLRRQNGSGAPYLSATSGGVTLTCTPGGIWGYRTNGKIMGSMTAGRQAMTFNGGAIASCANALPATPTSIRDGSIQSGVAQWNGSSKRLGLWCTQATPDPFMQACCNLP